MESLSTEGRAIYDSVTREAATQHARLQQDLKDFIDSSVDAALARAINTTMRSCVSKAQSDMQVYTHGVESTLQQSLDSIRAHIGLAATDDPNPSHRTASGDAEIGPDGHRFDSTTRRPGVGASGLYIPPPARGKRNYQPEHVNSRSSDAFEDTDHHSHHRMPRMDVPKFDGENPKLWQIQCEDYFDMYGTTPSLWVRLASL